MTTTLPVRRLLLALLIVTIWGSNFVAIKLALQDLPPLLLCALRFLFVAIPAVFFLPRPAVPVPQLLVYGFSMFAFQFGFMFLGMKLGVSAGLASLILQVQVFFTLGLAVVFLKETISFPQIAGTLLALAGFVVVGRNLGGDISAAGFACLVLAGASWSIGNLTSKRLGPVNPLALVAWASLPVFGAMALASLVFEGPALIAHSLTHVSLTAVLATAYTVCLSTHVAYSLWSWLLARHPATTITPFALLVPVFGMITSALFLREPLPGWKLAAAALVIAGLSLTVFGPALVRTFRSSAPAPAR
jgi:O-acetylserine/cysteine efflux transporter